MTKEIPPINVDSGLSTTGLLDFIKYLKVTLTKLQCFYLKASTFERDVGMILAAESTGLEKYVTNIRKFWSAYLSTKPVEEIGHEKLKVLEACMSQTKNLLVKRLAFQWYHYKIADLAEFDAWMEQLPEMLSAMNEHINRWDALRAQDQFAYQRYSSKPRRKRCKSNFALRAVGVPEAMAWVFRSYATSLLTWEAVVNFRFLACNISHWILA
jgi:hypothetical protein